MPETSATWQVGPRQDQLVGPGPDAGERLEITRPPIGERYDGLQIQVYPAGFDRLTDDLKHLVVVDAGRDHGLDDLLLHRRGRLGGEHLRLFDDEDRSPLRRRESSAATPPPPVQCLLEFFLDFVLELDLLDHGLRRAATTAPGAAGCGAPMPAPAPRGGGDQFRARAA